MNGARLLLKASLRIEVPVLSSFGEVFLVADKSYFWVDYGNATITDLDVLAELVGMGTGPIATFGGHFY
jgi:hypothetical protein